jgi:hypothetical protein
MTGRASEPWGIGMGGSLGQVQRHESDMILSTIVYCLGRYSTCYHHLFTLFTATGPPPAEPTAVIHWPGSPYFVSGAPGSDIPPFHAAGSHPCYMEKPSRRSTT